MGYPSGLPRRQAHEIVWVNLNKFAFAVIRFKIRSIRPPDLILVDLIYCNACLLSERDTYSGLQFICVLFLFTSKSYSDVRRDSSWQDNKSRAIGEQVRQVEVKTPFNSG